ncbi:hypothetical protein ACWKWW_22490, partial [Chryseobacterium cucumeris]
EKSAVIMSFTNSTGKIEHFKVTENSNFEPELSSKYPDIKSYIGKGVEDPASKVYFSISPLGLSYMEIYRDQSAVFILFYNSLCFIK